MLESMNSNTLEYQKLSKDEMQRRGILGRLVGVCADFAGPTRNGRKYPEKLWENVFNDPIMKERIDNGVCYGELGHPLDREETDMEKVALCMAGQPKKGSDGKLRAVFDILDTPNGRILKSLCDYGSTIGISSRGSGDLETDFDGNESVNPDSYVCEGFDAVLIPAVKEARLQYVSEALDKKRYNKTLRQKLTESIKKEDESNQKVIQESLNVLGINLNESNTNEYKGYSIQTSPSKIIIRDSKGVKVMSVETDDEATRWIDEHTKDKTNEDLDTSQDTQIDDTSNIDVDTDDNSDVDIQDDTSIEEDLNIAGLDIDTDDSQDESLDENKNIAGDDNTAMLEELQKALDLNKKLDEKITSLQEKLSVSYAKEMKLAEQIDGYKSRITKLSKSTNEVRVLNEKLNKVTQTKETSDARNKTLSEAINSKNKSIKKLNESVKEQAEKIEALTNKLNESVSKLKKQTEHNEELITENATLKKDIFQLKESYSDKLDKNNQLIEQYKNIARKSVDKYISNQARRLGISSNEIKNRLPESYSFSDIDSICEDLQEYKVNINNLPFSTNNRLREDVGIRASNVSNRTLVPVEEEVDELTLRLAGITK